MSCGLGCGLEFRCHIRQLPEERVAGTTRLELATSAVTAPSFGNCLKLRGTDGYQNRALEPQVTIIGP
jgi:hypothetical protein